MQYADHCYREMDACVALFSQYLTHSIQYSQLTLQRSLRVLCAQINLRNYISSHIITHISLCHPACIKPCYYCYSYNVKCQLEQITLIVMQPVNYTDSSVHMQLIVAYSICSARLIIVQPITMTDLKKNVKKYSDDKEHLPIDQSSLSYLSKNCAHCTCWTAFAYYKYI